MNTSKKHHIAQEGHPNADHCLNSHGIQCCLKQLIIAYYDESPEYHEALRTTLEYLVQSHPTASGISNWLTNNLHHPHTLIWGANDPTLEEAKEAILVIISSEKGVDKNEDTETLSKRRSLILEKFGTKVPEFREVFEMTV